VRVGEKGWSLGRAAGVGDRWSHDESIPRDSESLGGGVDSQAVMSAQAGQRVRVADKSARILLCFKAPLELELLLVQPL
jgi:hypothetical protein